MAFPQPVMGKCALLSGWVMGLGWTRAPVGTAEHCRIPLQIWPLALAAHLLRITEFLSIFTATARPWKTLEGIARAHPIHKYITWKQIQSSFPSR